MLESSIFYIAAKPSDCNQDQSLSVPGRAAGNSWAGEWPPLSEGLMVHSRQGAAWTLLGQRKSCPKLQRVAALSGDCQHYACLQQTCFAQDKEQPSESTQTLELVPGTWHPASALALRASTDRTQWERSWDWPGCGQDAAGMCLGCVWGQLGCRAAVIHPRLCSTHRFPWKSTMGRRNVW